MISLNELYGSWITIPIRGILSFEATGRGSLITYFNEGELVITQVRETPDRIRKMLVEADNE